MALIYEHKSDYYNCNLSKGTIIGYFSIFFHLIYDLQLLKLSHNSLEQMTVGNIVSLASNDVRLVDQVS